MNTKNKWLDRLKAIMNKFSSNKSKPTSSDSSDESKSLSRYFVKRNKQPNYFLSVFVTTLKIFLILFVILGFAGFGAVVGVGKAYIDSTPNLDIGLIEDQSMTSFIYDKDGNLVTEYYGYENRIWAPIGEIPEMLKNAFISIEDERFYAHNGLDYKRLFGAVVHNLRNESVQGGSTITQQLIKNTILTQEQTYKRKIQEMYLSIELEKKYDKDQILEAYLNTIHLGGSNYGIKAAAMDYFGKELDELTLRECALLAGITKNPWRYDPRRTHYTLETPEVSYERANIVLQCMYENGAISEDQYEEARFDLDDPFSNNFTIIEEPNTNDYPMKYFIEYVINDVRNRLMEVKGWEGDEGRSKAEHYIMTGGLEIHTTLDPEIQKTVEEAVYNYKNYPKFKNSIHNISSQSVKQPQAAAAVIDHRTGELRAIVGGNEPPTVKKGLNRAYMSDLPVGSSIKPLAVYGPFIEAGYPGGIIFENIPAKIDGWNDSKGKGYPNNYGGGGFTGPTDVRTGIRKSLNIVAARVILDRIGTKYSADKLIELGVNTKNEEPANLALGSTGNNMIEMAGAYATIANKGVYQEPISFTKVLDKDGNVILDKSNQVERVVFKESTTFILTEWMKEVVNGGTTTVRINNENGKRIEVAGKTGTNSNFNGVYFAGFTPYYAATVWIGHDDFNPPFRNGTTGGAYAAPLWKNFMEPIHANLDSIPLYEKRPSDVVKVTVCAVSGKLPNGDLCKNDVGGHGLVSEWFPKDAVPTKKCDIHREVNVCAYSGKLASPYCPEEHVVKKSVIILPKDSPYRQLSDDQLAKYLPGAFKDTADPSSLSYDNEKDRKSFCSLHTPEWKANEEKRKELFAGGADLISTVRTNMNNPDYSARLSDADRNRLENDIKALETAMEQGEIKLPAEGEAPVTEIPVFDPAQTQKAIDDLSKLNKEIFDAIQKQIEQEQQEPQNPGSENGNDNGSGTPPGNNNGDTG